MTKLANGLKTNAFKPSSEAVLELLSAGEMSTARKVADTLIAETPMDANAQYVSGLVSLMQGDASAAIPMLKNAYTQEDKNPVYAANLGVACLRDGKLTDAINYLETALKLQPDYAHASYNLGCALLDNHQPEAAYKQFSQLAATEPDNEEYICACGDAAREAQNYNEATRLYRAALKINPDMVRALSNLAPFLMYQGNTDEAMTYSRRAIELDPKQLAAYKTLGDCLVQQEEFEAAMDVYADAYDIDQHSAKLCAAIGKLWLETADHGEASAWFQKTLSLDADNIVALCGLAEIVRDNGDVPQALEMLQPVLDSNPDNIEVLTVMSDTLWEDGDANGALEHLKHIQRLQPERIAIRGKIGKILSSSGDVDRAIEEYQTALDQQPNCIAALNGLATSQRAKLDIENVNTMENMLANNTKLKAGARGALHNGLAYYYDSTKQHDKAAEHMQQSNRYQWESKSIRGWSYEPQKYEDYISVLTATFDSDYFERVRDLGNPDPTPVFIVAMPRSGTTLTEQILARHSKVLGIGERNFAIQAFNRFTGQVQESVDLSHLQTINDREIEGITQRYLQKLQELKDKAGKPDALRVVDKMPDNYSMVGWILTLFPNAKIIHAARDPRDVALSCWMTQFGSIRWACHTEHLVHRIKQYQRIMQHWREVIPDRFIELNYEDLVANQEQESKRLIEYIGLDWDESCLKFYESDRLVRTASITQVRQPIYNKSVARWKPYQQYISDLFEPLASTEFSQ